MAITVADLLEMPHLRLHLYSGVGGLDRDVSWTHTSDLPDPWEWLTGGELLLTNGMSFPADGDGQRLLVERLVEAGASALAIGAQMYCPPLTADLTEASERLAFPILEVEYPMPFVAISRAVAVANLLEQSHRLIRTERIYHALQRTVSDQHESSALRAPLSTHLACEVHVVDRTSMEPWYPDDPRPDPELRAVLQQGEGAARQLRAGAFAVPLPGGRDVRFVDIPTHPGAVLVLVSDAKSAPDAILTQHAATVIALELSQSLMSIEHRRRMGAELLGQLLDGRGDLSKANRQLQELGLAPASSSLMAITSEAAAQVRDLHITLWRNRLPHLAYRRSGVLYLLVEDPASTGTLVRSVLGPDAWLGASATVGWVGRMPEAVREAGWATRAAGRNASHDFVYGDATPLIGISGIDDASALVDRVLGRLLDYEKLHETGLVATLEAFFAHQRSWQKTADALQVHRQTVLYRIRKVEEITRLDLNDTGHIAELWLALQARTLLLGDS